MVLSPIKLDLPYAEWNPGQWDIITEIVSAFSEERPYVVVEAPTGVGKSAVALGVAHLMDRRAVVLTGTRQLQEQYVEALGVRKAMGRPNFRCAENFSHRASDADCVYGAPCDKKKTHDCPYYSQKMSAQQSRDSVLNYAYWLAQANHAGAFRPGSFRFPIIEIEGVESTPDPGLLVCDEAHLLESEILRFVEPTFFYSQCHEIGVSLPEGDVTLPEWRAWAAATAYQMESDYFRATASRSEPPDEYERKWIHNVITVYEACTALTDPAVSVSNWVVSTKHGVGGIEIGVSFRPVWVHPFTERTVLRHADRILFMSATILSKDLWCRNLGIPVDKVTFIQAPSPFPVQARPLYIHSVGSVQSRDRDSYLAACEAVDTILSRHPHERGIIHTASYDLARYIMARSRHRRRLIANERADDKPAVLNALRNTKGAVVVSPSMGIGVDLPYDLLRFQVIAKLSFPNKGDAQVAARMEKVGARHKYPDASIWYTWVTACSLVQTYGRGVRAVDDACVTYLLDGNWKWFRKAAEKLLPNWFSAAVKPSPSAPVRKTAQSVEEILREFGN